MNRLLILIVMLAGAGNAFSQLAEDGKLKNEALAQLNQQPRSFPGAEKQASIDEYNRQRATTLATSNAETRAKMLAKTRERDPFGTPMRVPLDTVAASAASKQVKPTADQVSADAQPIGVFESAIKSMRVGAVDAKHKEFLIGPDNFFEGDALDMQYKGQSFRVWIKEVSDTLIVFLDQQSKTVSELRFNNYERPLIHSNWGAKGATAQMPRF